MCVLLIGAPGRCQYRLGFMGAAYAIGIASLNNLLLTAAWVAAAGMQGRVWGRPTWDAFKVTGAVKNCPGADEGLWAPAAAAAQALLVCQPGRW